MTPGHASPQDTLWPRASGVLLHISSLPLGDLGPDAYRFVEFLEAAGQSWWQIMPVAPPGAGNSPYAARSAFAGDPRMISLERLANDGLLDHSELFTIRPGRAEHQTRLRTAFARLCQGTGPGEVEAFAAAQPWVATYAAYAARREQSGQPWWEWPPEVAPEETRAEELFQAFCQWAFERQWRDLRSYAGEHGVGIFGDLPIFVDLDSADVWAEPALFKLDADRRPRLVAGVPPDIFSATGQRWGNPLYDWDRQRRSGFEWWVRRMARTFELVDAVRLDHFRGFVAAWEIPAEAPDATSGEWVPGPGVDLFRAIEEALGRRPIAVEDLGIITPDVHAARDALGYPGMAVLQFGFGDTERTFQNPHLPHNYRSNSVVYTGTHDNDTTVGWWRTLDDTLRDVAVRYLAELPADPARRLIREVQSSVANTVIVPFQDWLGLGSDARMNRPGIGDGNWAWQFDWAEVPEGLAAEMREMARVYGRFKPPG